MSSLRCLWLFFSACVALDNGVGRVPPMGWNSWNSFVDVDLNEQIVKETADSIVSLGLDRLGYKYVCVDCGWSAPDRDIHGHIQPHPSRFPHGMAALGKYLHSKGLLFGIYTARGSKTCCGGAGYNAHQYADIDAKTFAEWGVDFVKVDSCGHYNGSLSEWEQFASFRDALNKTGRRIFLSVCPTIHHYDRNNNCHSKADTVYSPFSFLPHNPGDLANSFLVEFSNNGNTKKALDCHITAQEFLTYSNWTGPGAWNDMDLICTGCNDSFHPPGAWTPCKEKPGLTQSQGRTEFSIWAIMASPLLLSSDLRYMSKSTYDIISNTEVIAVNQDSLGHRSELLYSSQDDQLQLYCKKMGTANYRTFLVLNRGTTETSLFVQWEQLLPPKGSSWKTAAVVRDLWAHKDIAHNLDKGIHVQVQAQDVRMLTVQFQDPL